MPPRKKKPVTASTPLTAAEWRFVAEYVNNGNNATKAMQVVNAGLTYSSARSQASRLLNKVNVKNAVARETNRAWRNRQTNADRVLGEWENLAFAHIGEVLDLDTLELRKEIPASAVRAIAQLDVNTVTHGERTVTRVKVRMHPKGEALDRISRHLGLYKDLPPLETILALLPPAIAASLREQLAAAVPAGVDPPGARGGNPADPLPEWAEPDPDGAGGGDGDPAGPELPVPGDAVDAGPVAAVVPGEPVDPDPAPLLPPGGEEPVERGPDPGPLFDDG